MSPQDSPEEGEYVIGRVVEVKDFGATLNLLEFSERKAFVHISEVASGWVKYIRDFIREGQMVVAKITRIKKGSKISDASVRQVSGHRKQEKIRDWKNEQRASKLLELVSSQSSLDHEKLVEEIKTDMIDVYGSMYSAFESSLMDESLFKKEWKGKWVDNFIKIAVDNVTPPYVSIGGKFDLVSYDSKWDQSFRPDHPLHEGRKDWRVRWGRSWQDRHHSGTDPQHRRRPPRGFGLRRRWRTVTGGQ